VNRSQVSALVLVAVITAYWAYTMIDSLLREFSNEITFIDLGAIYIMGLISGIMLGMILAFSRKKANEG
jgi:hypothetical protein